VGVINADQEGVVGKPDDGALFSFVSVEEVSINGVVERSFSLAQGSHPLPTHRTAETTLLMKWCSVVVVVVMKCSALWAADNFVPVGGDAITAVGYKSELSNNVTVRYSFFSYNRSLDVDVGPFSCWKLALTLSAFLTIKQCGGGCRRQLYVADDALVPQVLSRHHHLALARPVHSSLPLTPSFFFFF
jgi:hypothetical protein